MGLRDLGALESAIAQPQVTFSSVDLYPTLAEKAAALCFALIQGHPFVDGNERVGHAAMETFLVLNGSEVVATVEDQGAGIERNQLVDWLSQHVRPIA